jgi:two-component system response regulator HydG
VLVNHFLHKYATTMNRAVPRVAAKALDVLMEYSWPGNVRELENAIERAMLIYRDQEIQPTDFPFQNSGAAPSGGQTLDEVEKAHIKRVIEEAAGNYSRTARILGIDRTTLYNKVKRYGLR